MDGRRHFRSNVYFEKTRGGVRRVPGLLGQRPFPHRNQDDQLGEEQSQVDSHNHLMRKVVDTTAGNTGRHVRSGPHEGDGRRGEQSRRHKKRGLLTLQHQTRCYCSLCCQTNIELHNFRRTKNRPEQPNEVDRLTKKAREHACRRALCFAQLLQAVPDVQQIYIAIQGVDCFSVML